MEKFQHDLPNLFKQLGLPSDEQSIEAFIAEHGPIPAHIKLEEAPCWSPSQSAFLREAFCDDSEWAEAVDQMNVRLR